jgi:hypothetical protein
LISAAKAVARDRLAEIPASMPHYSVGFLGVHDGRTSNFIFLDFNFTFNLTFNFTFNFTSGSPSRKSHVHAPGPCLVRM